MYLFYNNKKGETYLKPSHELNTFLKMQGIRKNQLENSITMRQIFVLDIRDIDREKIE